MGNDSLFTADCPASEARLLVDGMPEHDLDLILTLAGGLTAALVLGFITQKLRLSPIVGYLLAGIVVGPFTPGYVANHAIASQCADIGVILLMFGVGLHFHLGDLLAVRKIALPGALIQIAVATGLGWFVMTHFFGWSWPAGVVFGIAISVASTVVLIRVLTDNRALHTPIGHIAVGWLIVEDLFTVIVLVLLPPLVPHGTGENIWAVLGIALLKLSTLILGTLFIGRKVIPWLLGAVARTGSRELFTLAILALALGIAVASAELFGASMALGAFLAGMIVGQSAYGARAAAEALPMRDAFAVLFFVSIGMLFDPAGLMHAWPLFLATLGVVLIGKPAAAFLLVLVLRRPVRTAFSISVALAQIGEFSFILAALATDLKILPGLAMNALVAASIVSITLNPLFYRVIEPIGRWTERRFPGRRPSRRKDAPARKAAAHRAIVVGYGPVGRTLARILEENKFEVTVIEMNIDAVHALLDAGKSAIYGDAAQREILHQAGIEGAEGLVIAGSSIPAEVIVQAAREINPKIRILTRTAYLRESAALREAGANAVFTSEGEIALSMTDFLMRQLGATDEQVDRERHRVRTELF
jgi:monovalent cation:H+ antiporter-2, CPA2 family